MFLFRARSRVVALLAIGPMAASLITVSLDVAATEAAAREGAPTAPVAAASVGSAPPMPSVVADRVDAATGAGDRTDDVTALAVGAGSMVLVGIGVYVTSRPRRHRRRDDRRQAERRRADRTDGVERADRAGRRD